MNNCWFDLLSRSEFFPQEQVARLIALVANNSDKKIFLKDERSTYHFANTHFTNTMGLSRNSAIAGLNDSALCKEKAKVKIYQSHDDEVFATEKALDIAPPTKRLPISRLHPLHQKVIQQYLF